MQTRTDDAHSRFSLSHRCKDAREPTPVLKGSGSGSGQSKELREAAPCETTVDIQSSLSDSAQLRTCDKSTSSIVLLLAVDGPRASYAWHCMYSAEELREHSTGLAPQCVWLACKGAGEIGWRSLLAATVNRHQGNLGSWYSGLTITMPLEAKWLLLLWVAFAAMAAAGPSATPSRFTVSRSTPSGDQQLHRRNEHLAIRDMAKVDPVRAAQMALDLDRRNQGRAAMSKPTWSSSYDGRGANGMHRRQWGSDDSRYNSIATQVTLQPVQAAGAVFQIPNIDNTNVGTWANQAIMPNDNSGDSNQVSWFYGGQFPFQQTPNVNGQPTSNGDMAWQGIPPSIPGFDLMSDLEVSKPNNVDQNNQTAIQPYWRMTNVDNKNVKRVLISWPGKPRDSWKYATLFANALNYVYNRTDIYNIQSGSVLILAPVLLNQNDQNVVKNSSQSAVNNTRWVYFKNSNWELGGMSQYPNLTHKVSSYRVIDQMINMVMNQTEYPQLNQVVIAGHSMGGQATMRYAFLKKQKKYDPNIRYWIGNPGSWAWLVDPNEPDAYPNPNTSCPNPGRWPYGITDFSASVYGRKQAGKNNSGVKAMVDRYASRRVHYALGLLDNGQGDTHCQAMIQGSNHLARGANFIMMLNKTLGNWPANHSASFIQGVSHQDYPMIAATESLEFLFQSDFDKRYDPIKYHTGGHKGPKNGPLRLDPGFDNKTYKIVAWIVIVAFLIAIIIIFLTMSWIFTPNSNNFDRDYWEFDSKRRLL